jgi:hypothetical protein
LYCRDVDVDRFPALAGWRGLNDSAVREYFNNTVHAFVQEWGPLEELMQTTVKKPPVVEKATSTPS